jgi:hypothetical protein
MPRNLSFAKLKASMFSFRMAARLISVALSLAMVGAPVSLAEDQPSQVFPRPGKLSYRVEWRLVTAGTADILYTRPTGNDWQIQLSLQTIGFVNRLYHVLDTYRVSSDDGFCANSAHLDAQEGKRHFITQTNFDEAKKKVFYEERDLTKNVVKHDELDIQPCTHDVLGALALLGRSGLQPGKSITLPVSDGKKIARVRIEAQGKENVVVDEKKYQTIRYEAFLFDNVLYRRKGTLYIWVTDDAQRLPVQIHVQLGFPVGTVSLELQKAQSDAVSG